MGKTLFRLVALLAVTIIVGCQGQNLLPQLQNPPFWESTSGLPPTDPRNIIRGTALSLIKLAGQPSISLELKNGAIPYTLYAGFRSIEAQAPIRNDTILRLASMSKMITAVTLLKYVENDLIDLNDPVSKYIPAFADATVIQKVIPDAYPFSSVELFHGSPRVVIPLPYLSSSEVSRLFRKQAGIQLTGSLNGVKVDEIFTIMSFDPSKRTITVDLNCAVNISGNFSINGTLDVLPKLPNRWSPYDYANVPLSPVQKKREYYSTEPSKTVTIRHLVTHTAGINYASPFAFGNMDALQTAIMQKMDKSLVRWTITPTLDMDVVEWASRMAKIPMTYQPGTQWSYGPQAGVIGAVLVAYERADCCGDRNVGLYDIQKRVLFDPLGITDAGYFIHDNDPRRSDKISRLAHSYTALDTTIFGTPYITTLYGSLFVKNSDTMLPGLHASLTDGANPSVEGDANPLHPIYGSATPRRHEAGDAGLYMRNDEFQRIVTMLTQNGTYNGQQILRPETVQQMFTNQIGDLRVVHDGVPGGNVSWGYGVVVGDESTNPDPLTKTTAHWSGALGGWWFVNQRSNTAFTLTSNTLPGAARALASAIAGMTNL